MNTSVHSFTEQLLLSIFAEMRPFDLPKMTYSGVDTNVSNCTYCTDKYKSEVRHFSLLLQPFDDRSCPYRLLLSSHSYAATNELKFHISHTIQGRMSGASSWIFYLKRVLIVRKAWTFLQNRFCCAMQS